MFLSWLPVHRDTALAIPLVTGWIPVYTSATGQAFKNWSVFTRSESEAETCDEPNNSHLHLTVSQLKCSDFSHVPFHSSAELQNIIDSALNRFTVQIADWSVWKINLFLMVFLFQNSMDSIFVKEGMQKSKSESGLWLELNLFINLFWLRVKERKLLCCRFVGC